MRIETLYFISEQLGGTIETIGAGATEAEAYKNWYETIIEDTKAFNNQAPEELDELTLELQLYCEETIYDDNNNVLGYDDYTLENHSIEYKGQ